MIIKAMPRFHENWFSAKYLFRSAMGEGRETRFNYCYFGLPKILLLCCRRWNQAQKTSKATNDVSWQIFIRRDIFITFCSTKGGENSPFSCSHGAAWRKWNRLWREEMLISRKFSPGHKRPKIEIYDSDCESSRVWHFSGLKFSFAKSKGGEATRSRTRGGRNIPLSELIK